MACVQCDSMPVPGSSVTAEYRWGWTQADRTWHRRSHAAAQATDKPQDERCRRQASQRGLRPPAHLPSVSQQAATVVSGSPPRGSRPSSHLHTQNGAQRTQDNEATEVPITPGQTHRAAAWTVGSSDRGHPARTDAKHRARAGPRGNYSLQNQPTTKNPQNLPLLLSTSCICATQRPGVCVLPFPPGRHGRLLQGGDTGQSWE